MWRTRASLLLLCGIQISITSSFVAPRPRPSLARRVERQAWEPKSEAVVDGSRGAYGYWFGT